VGFISANLLARRSGVRLLRRCQGTARSASAGVRKPMELAAVLVLIALLALVGGIVEESAKTR